MKARAIWFLEHRFQKGKMVIALISVSKINGTRVVEKVLSIPDYLTAGLLSTI